MAAALASPAPTVRIEALRAYAASRSGDLPAAAADLRTSSDPRVRAAALRTLVARRHPQAKQWLADALRNVALPVRLAAISGLGGLGDPQSLAALRELLKERVDGIRRRRRDRLGPRRRQGGGPRSGRRRLVARAIAGRPGAGRLAGPRRRRRREAPPGRPQRRSPAEDRVGPVRLALGGGGAAVVGGDGQDGVQHAEDGGGRVGRVLGTGRPVHGRRTPPRRVRKSSSNFKCVSASSSPPHSRPPASAARSNPWTRRPSNVCTAFLDRQDFQGMKDFGPGLPEALERLVAERFRTLPEPVYRNVLPPRQPVFAALVRLAWTELAERRRAATDLVALSQERAAGTIGRRAARPASRRRSRPRRLAERPLGRGLRRERAGGAIGVCGNESSGGRGSPPGVRAPCRAHPRPEHRGVLLPALDRPKPGGGARGDSRPRRPRTPQRRAPCKRCSPPRTNKSRWRRRPR